MTETSQPFLAKFFKLLVKVVLGVLAIFTLLILLIRIPIVQQKIIHKATSYLSEKTGTVVSIDRFLLTYSVQISLEGFLLEDLSGDTLIYSKKLVTGVKLWPLIKGSIHLRPTDWEGLQARVQRDSSGVYNFQFLLDAFSNTSTDEGDISSSDGELQLDILSGPIDLTLFDLVYTDHYEGLDLKAKFDRLELRPEKISVGALDFNFSSILLENANVRLIASEKSYNTEEDTEEVTSLPKLNVGNFTLRNISLYYESAADSTTLQSTIGEFSLAYPVINLKDQILSMRSVKLEDSHVEYAQLKPSPKEIEINIPSEDSAQIITLPNWEMDIGELILKNNQIKYIYGKALIIPGQLNTKHLDFAFQGFEARNLTLRPNQVTADIKKLYLEEKSGFVVRSLTGNLALDEEKISIQGFTIETGNSFFKADLLANYQSLDHLVNQPESVVVDLSVSEGLLDLKDAFYFNPTLKDIEEIKFFSKQPFALSASIKGHLDDLSVNNLGISWGKYTQFQTKGSIKKVTDFSNLQFNLDPILLTGRTKDFKSFLPDSLAIDLPEKIRLVGSASGSLTDVKTTVKTFTDLGNIGLKGHYTLLDEKHHFDFDIEVQNLKTDVLLRQEDLGLLSVTGTIEGHGASIKDLDANLELQITDFCWRDVFFVDTKLKATYSNQQLFANIQTQEEVLESDIDLIADLSDSIGVYAIQIHMNKMDMQALGLTDYPLEIEMDAAADITGDIDNFNAFFRLHYGIAKTNTKTYDIKQLTAEIEIDSSHTYLLAKTSWMQLDLNANANPLQITQSFDRFFKQNLDSTYVDSIAHGYVNLDLNFNIIPDTFITEVLLSGLEDFETQGLNITYREQAGTLNADWPWEKIAYQGILLEKLQIDLQADQQGISYAAGFQRLIKDDFRIHESGIEGYVERINNQISLNLYSHNLGGDTLLYIGHDFHYQEDLAEIRIRTEPLIINKDPWHIPAGNLLQYNPAGITATDFKWSNKDQSFALSNIPGRQDDHLQISFDNFLISSLTSLFNEEVPPLDGIIKGGILVENLLEEPFFLANISVQDLSAMGEPLGNLSMEGQRTRQDAYKLDMSLKDGPIDLEATGDYYPKRDNNTISLDIQLNELDLSLVERLFSPEIRNASGIIKGKAKLGGSFADLKYDADLNFNKASFLVSKINEQFIMQEEKILINNEGIFFDQFEIRNSENQLSVINGSIDLDNLTDPGLNLKITADNFRLINSTRADNDLFYGIAIIDFDFNVTGKVSLPVVQARTRLKRGSDITFIVPESELDLIEKEGIVVFVDMQSGEDLEDQIARVAMSDLTGIELNALLQVDSTSVLKVLLDERSGDNLTVSGTADLNLGIETNGRISLSGSYIVTRGHYELNLYDLVKRRFEMVPGSQITWTGDPYNAILNLNALYRVRTASSDLMSAQLINADISQRNMYRQELPFEVYLRIGGELLQPQISFRIDMPETHRDVLSGNVYGRLKQLNENESELNKQVFSLMVLNRFLPEDLTGGSAGGGTTAIARSSVSQVLSNQLNTLSDRFIQGVDLNFDLDSYTDYQSGTGADVTQLNVSAQKSLFDDRLIISVGSQFDLENENRGGQQQAAEIIGDINIEYLITDDGRYRIRGFRRNEFEGAVEGLLIVAGVSLVYKREFDKLHELWRKPPKPTSSTEEIEKELKQILSEPIE